METKIFSKILKKWKKVGFGVNFGVYFGGFGENGLSRIDSSSKGVRNQVRLHTRSRTERPSGVGWNTVGVKTFVIGCLKV